MICRPTASASPDSSGKPLKEKSLITKIMRIGVGMLALFVTSIQLLNASPAKGQPMDQVKISLELKHESLVQAFQKIESQSNLRFMYRYKEVKDVRDLTLSAKDETLQALLE